MKNAAAKILTALIIAATAVYTANAASLNPPTNAFDQLGNPVSSMKSIDEIEPRRAILTLPYYVTNSGAYYLAKTLIGNSNNVGIQIECSDVQLDLSGFSLIGAAGSKDGIRILGTNENINIKNGSVKKWDLFGINGPTANDGSIVRIKANRNGLGGILFGDGATIDQCSVFGNGYKALLPPSYFEFSVPDSDYDTMDDAFEQWIVDYDTTDTITNINDVYPNDDFDGDGVSNYDEFMNNTDPTDSQFANGDGDMMDDAFEQIILDHDATNLNMFSNDVWMVMEDDDYDGDNVNNLDEFYAHTDPTSTNSVDADMDGLLDSLEYAILADDGGATYTMIEDIEPFHDYDQDGVSNFAEQEAGTDPIDEQDFPSGGGSQSEYANYTNPPSGPSYDDFDDPTDEPADDGIRVGGYATIKECKARGNRGSGIYAKYGSRIANCIGAGNYVDGIHVTDYCTVQDCTVVRNIKDGITLGSKCRIENNNCGQNGDFEMGDPNAPMGAGIRIVGNGNRVENNNVSGNALGIMVDDAFSMQFGMGAGMTGGGNLIIGNSSVDNWGAAFDLSDGDFMGGTMHSTDVGDPTNPTNAMMDANNPFSNFMF